MNFTCSIFLYLDMFLTKCKNFEATDHLKNNILHYACISVCIRTKVCFRYISIDTCRRMNQLLKVFSEKIHHRHSSKQLILNIKCRIIKSLIKILHIFFSRPLDLAKKAQMSPSIIDRLFSLSGRL